MEKTSPSSPKKNIAISLLAGVALAATASCTSLQRTSLKRSGSGLIKIPDGIGMLASGDSLADRAGFYSTNRNDPNYRAPEIYTGKGFGDRTLYTITVPVRAARLVGEGLHDVVGGVYGATVEPIIDSARGTKLESVADGIYDATNPDDLRGIMVPTLQYGLNNLEEKIGNVQTNSESRDRLEERMKTTSGVLVGSIPGLNHLGDNDVVPVSFWRKALRIPKELIYFIFSLGGSSSGAGNGGVGSGGGWGAGDPGAN